MADKRYTLDPLSLDFPVQSSQYFSTTGKTNIPLVIPDRKPVAAFTTTAREKEQDRPVAAAAVEDDLTMQIKRLQKEILEGERAAVERRQRQQKATDIIAPAQAGVRAAGQVQPTTSVPGAVAQTVETGVEGAAAGAQIGGGWGALVGGIVGLIAGGAANYFGLEESRKQKREEDKKAREIRALQDRARKDVLDQIKWNQQFDLEGRRYDRRLTAIQSRWNAMLEAQNRLNSLLTTDERLKDRFISLGR